MDRTKSACLELVQGSLLLGGHEILEGDILSLEIPYAGWWIAQVEKIDGRYCLTMFVSDMGRIIMERSLEAKLVAKRPTFLPSFGEDFPRDEEES